MSWETLEEDISILRKTGYLDSSWSCITTHIRPGDRIFLFRQGKEPRGILGSGHATSKRYEGDHFAYSDRTAHYADVRFDVILNPSKEAILLKQELINKGLTNVHWKTQGSGIRIPPDSAAILESLWSDFLIAHGHSPILTPDEVHTPERFFEGAVRQISVNAYERDPRAREACIKHHGHTCVVCGFNFQEKYGVMGKGFIHVHHLIPLAQIGQDYAINPIDDLCPVCPNCHAMLHRNSEPLSIEELKERIKDDL